MSTTASLCGFDPFNASRKHYNLRCLQLRSFASLENLNLVSIWKRSQCRHKKHGSRFYNRFIVFAATEGSAKPSQSDEKIPSWARPDSDEPPPWARGKANGSPKPAFEIPYYAYLLASAITAIAAVITSFHFRLCRWRMIKFKSCYIRRLVLYSSTRTKNPYLGSWILIVCFMHHCSAFLSSQEYLHR